MCPSCAPLPQPEDHQLWASHFDSLQRRAPVLAPTPAPLDGLEQRDWEPTSRLSLLSEAISTCGADSVRGVAADAAGGHSTRARYGRGGGLSCPCWTCGSTMCVCPVSSYLRTMTALLDPAQLEERERRRLKQLEQQVRPRPHGSALVAPGGFLTRPRVCQRAIEAQVEEKRQQREREEAMRRKEEEEEERRLSLERDRLEKRYELDVLKERRVRPTPRPSPLACHHSHMTTSLLSSSLTAVTKTSSPAKAAGRSRIRGPRTRRRSCAPAEPQVQVSALV